MKHLLTNAFWAMVTMTIVSCKTTPVVDSKLLIDHSRKGATVNPQMHGIFFEEINHSGDGALYAELIKNRNFEEAVLPSGTTYRNGFAVAPHSPSYTTGHHNNWKVAWNPDSLKMVGWSVIGNATYDVVSERPLHPNTPNAMKMQMKEPDISLQNEGYWGVPVKAGDTYNLRFYINAANYQGTVTAKIISEKGKVLSEKDFEINEQNKWQEYTAQMIPTKSTSKGAFQLTFSKPGTVYVDYVSLFPQKTFKNRKNGMRNDVAQMLADLKPGFIRWPGGCIAEGATLENRVKWKETLGDPMTRRSEWILWNYHCTWGFGYHEFLQLCEDLGADGMYVANVGLSCEVRNGDYTNDIEPFIQDICDAIEYAKGDVNTPWGAKRAAAGHPAPFNLKYVELGNEQIGDLYAERYNYLYDILKEKYPEITFISTLGLNKTLDKLKKVDMIDPHWYVNPMFFYENNDLFDSIERGKFDIYVGEYAAISAGNMDGALSEAAFISGMERNSDLVKIASYAPLLENNNRRDWPTNLIWVNNESVMGRASYYVQKMFSHNVPSYNIEASLQEQLPTPFNGHVGICGDSDQYRSLKITDETGKVLAESADLSSFEKVDHKQQARSRMGKTPTVSMLKSVILGKGSVEFEARVKKRLQENPFSHVKDSVLIYPAFVFGADETCLNYFTLNLGSNGDRSVAYLARVMNGESGTNRDPKGAEYSMNMGEWYKIRIEFADNNQMTCFINGERVLSQKVSFLSKHYAIAGYDEQTGETIIKVINATDQPFTTHITLNCDMVAKEGKVITLASDNITDENSFEQPTQIVPVETTANMFDKDFNYTFVPRSFTILRIKTSEK